jgi:hypothetical protein
MRRGLVCLMAAGCVAFGQSAPTQRKATARDMFFAGLDDTPAPAKPKPAPSKPARGKPDVPFQRASSKGPLGLRYALLKVNGPESTEVAQTTEFTSGDRIRLKVQPNDDGYLYIVHQGTSGNWGILYPKLTANPESNRIQAGVQYEVPPDSAFRFSGNPGTERLFVLLTRVPERDLDTIIYSVKGRPEERQGPRSDGPALMAANRVVENPLINRLRAISRDLVLDDVPAETPAGDRDMGVYVVNPAGVADSRVVADIQLRHK